MGKPTRAARADWGAPALFWTAERNSGVVRGVSESGVPATRVLENLSERLCSKAIFLGSFGMRRLARRSSAFASRARIASTHLPVELVHPVAEAVVRLVEDALGVGVGG